MMANDSRSTPARRPLGEETAGALRDAVVHLWSHPAGPDDALQAAVAQMVAEARTRSLRAEDLIVAFKDLLTHLPELNAPERRLEAVHFRERLITLCIKAYYS